MAHLRPFMSDGGCSSFTPQRYYIPPCSYPQSSHFRIKNSHGETPLRNAFRRARELAGRRHSVLSTLSCSALMLRLPQYKVAVKLYSPTKGGAFRGAGANNSLGSGRQGPSGGSTSLRSSSQSFAKICPSLPTHDHHLMRQYFSHSTDSFRYDAEDEETRYATFLDGRA